MMGEHALGDPYADGLKLAAAGRHLEAITAFETALKSRPDDERVLFALGTTADALELEGVAEKFYRKVLASDPKRLEAIVNLANLLRRRGSPRDAAELVECALEDAPDAPELWLTLGSAMREAGEPALAIEHYREALRLKPNYPEAIGNLADLAADAGDVRGAIALYDRVMRIDPHNAQARLNRAILHLLSGNLSEGWRDYGWRLKIKGKGVVYTHGLPKWTGGAIRRTRLLVTMEQGIGDQIMFASVMPDLEAWAKRADGRVIFECEPRLAPLFARSFPGVAVRPSDIDARGGAKVARYQWLADLGGADAAIELGSLPRFLRKKLAEFPVRRSYLVPPEDETARWSNALAEAGAGPYIGLCWRSGDMRGLRALQYAPRDAWAAFAARLPGTLVSLQYDASADEIRELEARAGRTIIVPPALDQKNELDRTAGLVSGLDAVVSAPTAVAWMAAGLGVETFKLLYNTSWTSFGQEREPFAPACLCVSPGETGDWASAFDSALTIITRRFARI